MSKIAFNNNSVILLDGSIGGEIYQRVPEEFRHLWGNAAFFGNGPKIARDLHSDYFKAGAQIATTNSYVAVKTRLVGKRAISKSAEEICKLATEAANDARDKHGSGLVAGSLGPLFNSYRPDLDISHSFDDQVLLYSEYINNLEMSDLLLFETVASSFHGNVILEAIKNTQPNKPVWLSVTVDDNDGQKLRSGEFVRDFKFIIDSNLIQAILVNCSKPEAISDTLTVLKEFGIPFGAYANDFEDINDFVSTRDYSKVGHREDLNSHEGVYADFVMKWIKEGASIVGGCCGIGPEYIRAIAERVIEEGYTLTKFE